jgi:hypothetical protein
VRTERARLLNLVALVVMAAGIALFLDGPAFWIGAALLVAVSAFGTFSLLAELDPRGVPVESLTTPAVASFVTVGLARLAGPTPAGVVALAAGAVLIGASLFLEARLLGPADRTHARRVQQLVPLVVLLAFLGFTSVAGAIYGGPADTGATPTVAGTETAIIVLALTDALVAFILGYRLAATRSASVRQAAWAAGTFAVVIGVAAALLRAIALPRLLGPALLAAIFYLWSAYRSASRAERRSGGWLTEYLALAGAAVLAVAWNLLLR